VVFHNFRFIYFARFEKTGDEKRIRTRNLVAFFHLGLNAAEKHLFWVCIEN